MMEVPGKVLSEQVRAGVKLCSAFQVAQCLNDDNCIDGKHACAVLLRSGRACGMKHTVKDCHSRKAVIAATTSQVQSGTRKRQQQQQPEGE